MYAYWYLYLISNGHIIWSYHSLTHWGRVTHICVSIIITIGSDNGLSPDRRQAITCTYTNAGILLIGPLGTNYSQILIKSNIFSFKKMHLKMPSAKRRPFCLGLNVITANAPELLQSCAKPSISSSDDNMAMPEVKASAGMIFNNHSLPQITQ